MVFNAKVLTTLAGLETALRHPFARFTRHIVVILDNEEAAVRLHTGAPTQTSSIGLVFLFFCFPKFHELFFFFGNNNAVKMPRNTLPFC